MAIKIGFGSLIDLTFSMHGLSSEVFEAEIYFVA